MGDEIPNTMNLDLNLGPVENLSDETEHVPATFPLEGMNLEDLLDGGRLREVVRQRSRWRSVLRNIPVPEEARSIALEFIGGSESQTGEASVVAEERPTEATKMCDNNNGYSNDETLGKKEDNEKGSSEEGSFFDCNICLDLAKEPVVTCCGHLFCWPCLYRWLHLHSDAKECPVCKGEVTVKNVTPIYGRGTNLREPEEDSTLKIPHRPQARRVESWRQTIQRTAFTIPMEEMIRRLGSRFDWSQVQSQIPEGSHELPERSSSLLNRILTSRGMRREQNPVLPSDDLVDLTHTSPTNQDALESQSRRLSSLLLRRSNSHRAANIASLASAFGSTGRLVEPYFHSNAMDRNQEQPLPVDDTDSVSSIAAVIHSESQTVDTAVEIDSTVTLSTSSSRRRNDTSRISDVDSGDSRAPRRRRLN